MHPKSVILYVEDGVDAEGSWLYALNVPEFIIKCDDIPESAIYMIESEGWILI